MVSFNLKNLVLQFDLIQYKWKEKSLDKAIYWIGNLSVVGDDFVYIDLFYVDRPRECTSKDGLKRKV